MFTCLALDEDHRILSHIVSWVRVLAAKPGIGHITVLTPECGRHSLPDNVTVRDIRRSNKFLMLIQFYRDIFKALSQKIDFFFVCQGGPYPGLLLPIKLATGKPIYQWKAHSYVGPVMRFYARYCDDLIFTAVPSSFPMNLDKIKAIGHGIDTDLFDIQEQEKTSDLIAVGRIAGMKRIHVMLEALAECKSRYGRAYRLDLYGPCADQDRDYKVRLEKAIAELDLVDTVVFKGGVPRSDLPRILNRYRASLFFCGGAFGKAAGEAMACGLPVITTNPSMAEVIPRGLNESLVAPINDTANQAKRINEVLSWNDDQRRRVGSQLRDVIRLNHSLKVFFDKVLAEIGA